MWLAGPRVSGYDGNGSGVSLQWCWHAACFQRCPSRCHMSDKNKLNRTDLYTHVYSSGSMCSCCSWSAAKRRRLRVRGCLQLTWLGELVRTFSSEPGTRGPGHHDAMTEAPGRKNDCHFSSVPGARGRAAKIGEVFLNRLLSESKQYIRTRLHLNKTRIWGSLRSSNHIISGRKKVYLYGS